MSSNNNKAPGWFAGLILFIFFAGAGLAIAGSETNSGALIGFGMVVLFGGTGVCILIANAVVKSKKNDDDEEEDPFTREPAPRVREGEEDHATSRKLLDGREPVETVGDVMEREDELMALFEAKAPDLIEKYWEEADVFWDEYHGDDWDENVDAVNGIINKYYKLYVKLHETDETEPTAEPTEKTPQADETLDETTAETDTIPTKVTIDELPPAREMPEAPPMPTYEPVTAHEQPESKSYAPKVGRAPKIEHAPGPVHTHIVSEQPTDASDDRDDARSKRPSVGYKGIKKK